MESYATKLKWHAIDYTVAIERDVVASLIFGTKSFAYCPNHCNFPGPYLHVNWIGAFCRDCRWMRITAAVYRYNCVLYSKVNVGSLILL